MIFAPKFKFFFDQNLDFVLGNERLVEPHPNFRAFFTVDCTVDSGRQVSKALRNRCLEVFVDMGVNSLEAVSGAIGVDLIKEEASELPFQQFSPAAVRKHLLSAGNDLAHEGLKSALTHRLACCEPSEEEQQNEGKKHEEVGPFVSLAGVVDGVRVVQSHAALAGQHVQVMATTHALLRSLLSFFQHRGSVLTASKGLDPSTLEGLGHLSAAAGALSHHALHWRALEKWSALVGTAAVTSSELCSTTILRDLLPNAYLAPGLGDGENAFAIVAILQLAFDTACHALESASSFSQGLERISTISGEARRVDSAMSIILQELLPLATNPTDSNFLRAFLERSTVDDVTIRIDLVDKLLTLYAQNEETKEGEQSFPNAEVVNQCKLLVAHPLVAKTLPSLLKQKSFACVKSVLQQNSVSSYTRELVRAVVSLARFLLPVKMHDLKPNPISCMGICKAFSEGQVSLQTLPHQSLAPLANFMVSVSTYLMAYLEELEAEVEGKDDESASLLVISQTFKQLARLRAILCEIELSQWAAREAEVLGAISLTLALVSRLSSSNRNEELFTKMMDQHKLVQMSSGPQDANYQIPPSDAFTRCGGLKPAFRAVVEYELEQSIVNQLEDGRAVELLALVRSCGILRAQHKIDEAATLENNIKSTLEEKLADKSVSNRKSLPVIQDLATVAKPTGNEHTTWTHPEHLFQWRAVLELLRFVWQSSNQEDDVDVGTFEELVKVVPKERNLTQLLQSLAAYKQNLWSNESSKGEKNDNLVRLEMAIATLSCLRESFVGGCRAFLLARDMDVPVVDGGFDVGLDAGSLILSTGGNVAFSWNYCAWVLPKVNASTAVGVRANLQSLMAPSRFSSNTNAGDVSLCDWPMLARFVIALFDDLVDSDHGVSAIQNTFNLVSAILQHESVDAELRETGKKASNWLLKQIKSDDASMEGDEKKEEVFPASRDTIISRYARPVLESLHSVILGRVEKHQEAQIRGLVWVLASMWRLHGGGGQIWPGGRDPKEEAIRQMGEVAHSRNLLEKDVNARVVDELIVTGHESSQGGSSSCAIARDADREQQVLSALHLELSQQCCLRPGADGLDELELGKAHIGSLNDQGTAMKRYADFCKEVEVFVTNVASHDQVKSICPSLNTLDLASTAACPAAHLAHFCTSVDTFCKRLVTAYPLHQDLVLPVQLAAQGLSHGLQLVHHSVRSPPVVRATSSGNASDVSGKVLTTCAGAVPQMPTELSTNDVVEIPEGGIITQHRVLQWLLRWHAVQRLQNQGHVSGEIQCARMSGLFKLLQEVGKTHDKQFAKMRDEERERENDWRQKPEADDSGAEEVDDTEAAIRKAEDKKDMEMLFPMPAKPVEHDPTMDFLEEGDDDVMKGGLFDTWDLNMPQKEKKDSEGDGLISSEIWAEICNLCIMAFGGEDQLDSDHTKTEAEVDALRAEALDQSYELAMDLLRSDGDAECLALALPNETEKNLIPLMGHRLERVLSRLAGVGAEEDFDVTAEEEEEAEKAEKEAEEAKEKGEEVAAPVRKHLPTNATLATLKDLRKRRRCLDAEAASSFYGSNSPALLIAVRPMIESLKKTINGLLEQFPDHPALVMFLAKVERVLLLPLLTTTPMTLVHALEYLMDGVQYWETTACRAVSLRPAMEPIRRFIVELRAKELRDWRALRQNRESYWRRKGAFWWFHLVNVCTTYDSTDLRGLFDELMRFLRISPLGEFELRLRMLRAIATILRDPHLSADLFSSGVESRNEAANIVMGVFRYAEIWLPVVNNRLEAARTKMDKSATELSKLQKWELKSDRTMMESIRRCHGQLTRAIKEFDVALQEMTDTALTALFTEFPHVRAALDPAKRIDDKHAVYEAFQTMQLNSSNFVLDTKIYERFSEIFGDKESTARFTDNDEFWQDSSRVLVTAPQLLGAFRKVVGRLLSDVPAFTDSPLTSVASEFMTLFKDAERAIQNPETAVASKRRIVYGVKEELEAAGIPSLPLSEDLLSLSKLFAADPCPAPTANGRWNDQWLEVHNNQARVNHWFMRIRSLVNFHAELTGAEIKRWQGYAMGIVRLAEQHRLRCMSFQKAADKFRAYQEIVFAEDVVSFLCKHDDVQQIAVSASRLREAAKQVIALPLESNTSGEVKMSMKRLAASAESALEMLRKSPETTAWPLLSDSDDALVVETAVMMRVRDNLIADLCRLSAEVKECMPENYCNWSHAAAIHGVVATANAFITTVSTLESVRTTGTCEVVTDEEVTKYSEEEGVALRASLHAMQQSLKAIKSDPAFSSWYPTPKKQAVVQAKEEGEKDEDEEEPEERSRFGCQYSSIPSLSKVLPLEGALLENFETCVLSNQVHGGSKSVLTPFAKQLCLVSTAVADAAMDALVGASQVAVQMLPFVCFHLENGFCRAQEGDGDGDGQEGDAQWEHGTFSFLADCKIQFKTLRFISKVFQSSSFSQRSNLSQSCDFLFT